MKTLTALLVIGMFLTTVAMADDADDVEAVVREHFTTLNAGNMDAHLEQHHVAQLNRFMRNGLRVHFSSFEEQKNQIRTVYDNGSKYDLQLRDVEVNVYGNSAVVSAYMTGNIVRGNGNTVSVADRYSAMLVKQGGQWKTVHTHNSPLRIPPTQ